jgi:hypothetical protein
MMSSGVRLACCVAILLAIAVPASAQERPAPSAEFAAGALLFADEGVVTEAFAGGTARFYVSPRVGIGPELSFVSGENHSHFIVTGNVTFDILAPTSTAAVRPFVVAGGGLFQTREDFPNGTFTSSDGAFTAGGGVRVLAGSRAYVGVEARVGWELHLRVNAMIGVRLGG